MTVYAVMIPAILGILLVLFLVFRFGFSALRDKNAPVKTEKAEVADKFVSDQFAGMQSAMAKRPQYFVVFQMEDKMRSFRVSEFSYSGYKVGDRGTVKYKGDKLISFE